ncbi:MAG: metal-sulfur cluster assembly factor [Pirellulales bacterium]
MSAARYADRTDGVSEKLRMLASAHAAGRLDLAMSLAESAKDTLSYERQLLVPTTAPTVTADQWLAAAELPEALAAWCEGWTHVRPLDLFETVGIERHGEPVEITLSVPSKLASDLARELRVARWDQPSNALVEIACQVDDETAQPGERLCRLTFLADVAAHQHATYFVFCCNPWSERTDYTTDLQVRGEGYGLDIENHHYVARLSRQVGQLERLTSKRQHGLELYAGGKGHGEPAGIDWAHDYVDVDHFQKLRMRNWPSCPNYEVTRGRLCARIRRWGFPYSPLHPVFTPSRIHMDQTYRFYAGLPYFFKESRFDVVKDVDIEAMRDDEWVFSGYSFTDTLWFDAQGRLHQGEVPPGQAENLWGVGFFNRTSRDAFAALWLEHTAEGLELAHGGVPTLHYDGHGQLWSRYPAQHARLKAGTTIHQRNAYYYGGYEGAEPAAQFERLRHQLLHPLEVHLAQPRAMTAASAPRPLARPGETQPTAPLKPAIWKALAEVKDEQFYKIDANIVDLGYVYDVREQGGVVSVLVTMPHRGRPEFNFLVTAGGGRVEPGIRERVLKIPGVRDVVVQFTWNPAWTVHRLTEKGQRELGLRG